MEPEKDLSLLIEARLREKVAGKMTQLVSPELKEEDLIAAADLSDPRKDDADYPALLIDAALTGAFIPAAIVSRFANERHAQLLNRLAADSSVISGTPTRWLLLPETRVRVLQGLLREGTLFSKAAKAAPDDAFGKLLIAVITQGTSLDVTTMERNELLTLSSVLEALEQLAIDKPARADVRSLLQRDTLLNNYLHLVANFTGRAKELSNLQQFMQRDAADSPIRFCVLKGVGGSGKSTLLTKFAKEQVDSGAATVVIIDFDRPGMEPNDTIWLNNEVTRQVGLQVSAIQTVNEQREENFRERTFYTSGHTESASYDKRRSESLLFLLALSLAATTPGKPLLIVMDTLEEVVQQKGMKNLWDWIFTVEEAFLSQNFPLRFVLSGRLYEETAIQRAVFTTVNVGDFDKVTAKTYLKSYGVEPGDADSIVRSGLIPLRPLELKLVASSLKSGVSLPELLAELRDLQGLTKGSQLYTGIIYRRVLARLKDPVLREIAYPGLILRYVNAEIFRYVLVPALGLEPVSAERAAAIIDDLASYGWLAYRESGNVWHRKELRRHMLLLMEQKDPLRAKELREAAIRYFESFDPAEATYHRLMLTRTAEDVEQISDEELRRGAAVLDRDIIDLPPAANATLRYLQRGRAAAASVMLLPDRYFIEVYDKVGRGMVSREQFKEAYAVYMRGKRLGIVQRRRQGRELLDFWEQEMLFCLAEFSELRALPDYGKVIDVSAVGWLNALFFPTMLDPGELHAADIIAMYRIRSWTNEGSNSDWTFFLNRLSYATVVTIYDNQEMGNLFKSLTGVATTSPDEGRFPGRTSLLLDIATGGRLKNTYLIPAAYCKLDISWPLVSHDKHTLDELVSIFRIPQTARIFLNRVDLQLRLDLPIIPLVLDQLSNLEATIPELLRGPDPMFRQPCKAAIQQALADGLDPELLRTVLTRLIPFNIRELHAAKFRSALKARAGLLETLIELVDRGWNMRKLVEQLCEHWTTTKKLYDFKIVYVRLDKAMYETLERGGRMADVRNRKK